jgi:hypothetical protein
MHRTSNATSAGLNPAVGTKFIYNFNIKKMNENNTYWDDLGDSQMFVDNQGKL